MALILVSTLMIPQSIMAGTQKPGQLEGQLISIQEAKENTGKRTFTGPTLKRVSFPLSGIGTGIIHFNGNFKPNKWDIGAVGDMSLMANNSLFAISANYQGDTYTRVLQRGGNQVFETQPTNSTRTNFNKQGTYFIGTTEVAGGSWDDAPTGSIVSDSFILPADCNKVTALVGGGNNINNLYLGLYTKSDHTLIGKLTGHNSDAMHLKTMPVSSTYANKEVYFRITDENSGGWGHIDVDNIQLKDSNNAIVVSDFINGDFETGDLTGWCLKSTGDFSTYPELEATFEYPLAKYEFKDDLMPLTATMDMFSPMIPLSADDSAVPSGVFTVTLTNGGDSDMEVSLLSTLANGLWGNDHQNVVSTDNYGTYITMSSIGFTDGTNQEGSLCLQTSEPNTTYSAGSESANALLTQVVNDTELNNKDSHTSNEKVGGLCTKITLASGETKELRYSWSWYFPHFKGKQLWGNDPTDISRRYCSLYNNVEEVMKDLVDRKDTLIDTTLLYHDTLYDTNLPYYVTDAVATTMDVLRSPTFYYTKNGDVYAWEGSCGSQGGGCCQGNCTHVYNYVEGMPHLFPSLARRWKEMDYDHNQRSSGWVNNRFNSVPAENSVHDYSHWMGPAFDGNAGSIVGAYREHLNSKDFTFLNNYWPKIKKQMNGMISECDPDENGMNSNGDYLTTYDEFIRGASTITTGQYHAALRAAEEMAKLMGEDDLAQRYRTIFEKGSKSLDQITFNGEYYEQVGGENKSFDYNSANMTDQLLAQAYAHLNGLGYLLDENHVRSAAHSIFKYNFFHDVPQSEIDDVAPGASPARYLQRAGEDLLFIARQPNGGTMTSTHGYTSEDMTGFSYKAATELIYEGYIDEAMAIVKAIRDRFDGIDFNPLDELECGCYYLRSMASYGVLLAATGIEKNGPAKTLGFNPNMKPEDLRAFYCNVEGWGTFQQSRSYVDNSLSQTNTISVAYGQQAINELALYIPEDLINPNNISVDVNIDGSPVSSTFEVDDNGIIIALPQGTIIDTNSTLNASITLDFDGKVSPTLSHDFNDGHIEEWTVVSGEWKNKGATIQGQGQDVWFMNDLEGSNFIFEADIKLNGGSSILRFRSTGDGSEGYAVALEPTDVKLYKFPYVPIDVAQIDNAMNTWHHLKIVAEGSTIKAYLNHDEEPIIEMQDSDFLTGHFGLGAYGDSEFDNIIITVVD